MADAEAIKLASHPNKLVGCYSIDLYCMWVNPSHDFQEFPHGYNGETFGQCAKQARKAGWIIHRTQLATCPKCAKAFNLK